MQTDMRRICSTSQPNDQQLNVTCPFVFLGQAVQNVVEVGAATACHAAELQSRIQVVRGHVSSDHQPILALRKIGVRVSSHR